MGVTIRCSECHKKISIDEAFAGSMCRCPYCKSIVLVPKAATTPQAKSAQVRPGRPTTPSGAVTKSGSAPVQGGTMGSRPIIQLVEDEIDKSRMEKETKIKSPLVVDDINHEMIGAAAEDAKRQESQAVPDTTQGKAREEIKDIASDIVLEAPKVDQSKLTEEQLAAIPTANPIVFQGVVSLVLIFVLIVMVGACVFLGIRMFSGSAEENAAANGAIYESTEAAEEAAEDAYVEEMEINPFKPVAGKSLICGINIAGPVVYCIDGGTAMNSGAMGSMYPLAKDMVRASVMGMTGQQFATLVAEEAKVNTITKLISGGNGGEQAIRQKLMETMDDGTVTLGGLTDLEMVTMNAVTMKPKTVVLLLNQKKISSPTRLAKYFEGKNIKLVIVLLTATPEQLQAAKELAKLVGNGSTVKTYTMREMEKYYEESDLPID